MTMLCPVCGKRIQERRLERYFCGGDTLEICPDCREDFERETGIELTSDVLDQLVFDRFWTFATENIKPQENPS